MSAPTVQAAVIGLGFIGKAHIEALRRCGVPIAGVLGSSPESTQREAQALGLRAYASLDELLGDPQVGSVHQCGPNDIHAVDNLAALAAGKMVFSEKPLGIDVAQCAQQVAAARQSGKRNAVNFTYRGYAAVQAMRDLIAAGEIGQVRYLRGHYLQDWLLYDTDFNWRVTAPAEQTRAVADIGSHLSDLARFVTGLEPQRVLAQFSTLHPVRRRPLSQVQTFAQEEVHNTKPVSTEAISIATEDQASLLVNYTGGVKANFELSQVAAGHKNDLELEVIGTQGTVRWQQERPEQLWLGTRGPDQTLRLKDPAHPFSHYPGGHPEGYPDAITNLMRAFYAGQGHYPTFADGLAAAQFIAAAYHSHLHQGWTEVG